MSGIKNTVQKFVNFSTGGGFKTNEQRRRPKENEKRRVENRRIEIYEALTPLSKKTGGS